MLDKGAKTTHKRRKNRQTKNILVFDEKARAEFLTGFKKRKDERRLKAHEKNERLLKEEKKKLQQKRKELMAKHIRHDQYLPPDLEELAQREVQELPQHTVTITDISVVDLAGQDGMHLGLNKFHSEKVEKSREKEDSGTEGEREKQTKELSSKKKSKILRDMNQKLQQKTSKHLKQTLAKKSKSKSTKAGKGKRKLLSKKKKHHRKIKQ